MLGDLTHFLTRNGCPYSDMTNKDKLLHLTDMLHMSFKMAGSYWPKPHATELHEQVLHVAVLARHVDTVEALLEAGWSGRTLNARRWTALQEAVALGDRACAAVLHSAEVAAEKAMLRVKRDALLQTMRDMPNISFKVLGHSAAIVVKRAPLQLESLTTRSCINVERNRGIVDASMVLPPDAGLIAQLLTG